MKPEAEVRLRAMDHLARREHSFIELRRKLIAKGLDQDQVDQALCDLRDEGLQSDERFTEAYIKMRADRGYGPLRIEGELRERGISDETSCDTMDGYDWSEIAAEARQKRFGIETPRDFKDRARQMRFLQYRGFTSDHIKRGLL